MHYSTSEFEALYRRGFPPSMRLAMSLLHDEEAARDVVQEVFLKLLESEVVFTNPTAYIVRAVRNGCLSRLRTLDTRERIRQRLTLRSEADDDYEELPADEIPGAIERLLTPREQQVVGKIYTDGVTYREAADQLGVSVAAINKYLVAALKKLRTHFKNT